MSKQIITISKDYQIEADHPNYTLQTFVGGKTGWKNVGFYSSVKNAIKKFIEISPLAEKDMALIHYAESMMDLAQSTIDKGIK